MCKKILLLQIQHRKVREFKPVQKPASINIIYLTAFLLVKENIVTPLLRGIVCVCVCVCCVFECVSERENVRENGCQQEAEIP